MPTIVATPGAVNANSYCTVNEADAYHTGHLYASAWTSASTTTKEAALIMSTRLLDTMYEWGQWPTSSDQALLWPRTGLLARNQLEYVDDDEIPPELKQATAEFARQLISKDRTADVETDGITQLSAGSVSLSFQEGYVPKVIPDAVLFLLPRWWGRPRGVNEGMYDLMRS